MDEMGAEVSEHDGFDGASKSRRRSVHETGNELVGRYERLLVAARVVTVTESWDTTQRSKGWNA